MIHEGSILVPINEEERVVCKYWVQAYKRANKCGINKGKIYNLTIKVNGETTAEYDRGWVVEPDEKDIATQFAYCILLYEYN